MVSMEWTLGAKPVIAPERTGLAYVRRALLFKYNMHELRDWGPVR